MFGKNFRLATRWPAVSRIGLAACAAFALAIGAGPVMVKAMARPMPAPQVNSQDLFADSSEGWLGVGVSEVTPDQAREMKLGQAYGVMISQVEPNSPAAKAGIRKGDVITEYNGMRVEGAAEFRRVVRETPPGHTAQISVWRDGHSEKLTAEIAANSFFNGNSPQAAQNGGPNGFPNGEPDGLPNGGPKVPNGFPGGSRSFGPRFAPGFGPGAAPALGVAAQNLSGQLGEYFGAPGGEGVLVTEVRAGSVGEKAGLKAGDVITKVNGERVRNMAELREHLASARDAKSVALGVIRRGTEMSLDAAIEMPQPPNRGTGPGTAPGAGPAPGPGLDRRIPL